MAQRKILRNYWSFFLNVPPRLTMGGVTQGVNFKILKQLLSPDVIDGGEAYEFNWVGKKKAIVEANKPIRKTLRPCKEKSKNWDTTENIYIEGDNLEALKLLQESYLGKVKMIYIDPPYNTGSDFIYKDDFSKDKEEYQQEQGLFDEEENKLVQNTETNGRFHSDWCSMIYSRLLLARNLLQEDGLILIYMDEHEIINLPKICDEIFGASNNLGTIIWDKRNPKGDAHSIAYQHENILFYAKNKEVYKKRCVMQRHKKNAETILSKAKQLFFKQSLTYTLEQINKDFSKWISNSDKFTGGEKAYCHIDDNGDVYREVSMAWPNKTKAPDNYFIPLIHPVTHKPCPIPNRGWRNPPDTMQKLLKDNQILFGNDETTIPNRKYLLKDNMDENIPSILYYGGSDTALLESLGIPFDTPKVVDICAEHIASLTKDNDLILDFFSGSATIAHAVMQVNQTKRTKRKFIMVQIPEQCNPKFITNNSKFKTICDIGEERIRRAGEKIKADNPLTTQDLDVGFRVFKVDESNMKDVYYSAEEFTQESLSDMASNIKEDRSSLDLLFGCIVDWGVSLSEKYTSETIEGCTIHNYGDGDLLACFDENIPEAVFYAMARKQPHRVVFRDSCFQDSPAKINVTEVFKLLSPDTTIKVI